MNITNKIIVAFSLTAVFMFAVVALTFWNTQQLTERNFWVNHTYQTIQGAQAALSLLKDAETGQRGFLLTGSDKYLEPYRSGSANLRPAIDQLRTLTADNAQQKQNIDDLSTAANLKLDELAETINIRRTKGLDEALNAVRTDRGKVYMDSARKAVTDIEAEENRLLKQREVEATNIAGLLSTSLYFAGIILILFLCITAYTLNNAIVAPLKAQATERRGVMTTLTETISKLAGASSEILAIVTQSASGAQEQAAALAETVSTVDELSQTSAQSAQYANAVAQVAKHCDEIGKTGRNAVEETVTTMEVIQNQSQLLSADITGLADQAQAIGDITSLVDDIAEQTNLLALNAAIEAARAGEHGRGFAVVATEVKALAEQSKRATAQVREILGEIQKATNSAVVSTSDGVGTVKSAIKVATQAGDTIRTLVDSLGEAAAESAKIADSAAQQSLGVSQIQQAMRNIHEVTQQNLASSRQSEMTAQDLKVLGLRLQELLTSLESQEKANSGLVKTI
ncbi:MAG: CHASE3 domain-containing protein [Cyanobacteria bacterium REEB67]|nr:CHASE3 domain-containing protein [Cyanobacteria bacterium REEB67]